MGRGWQTRDLLESPGGLHVVPSPEVSFPCSVAVPRHQRYLEGICVQSGLRIRDAWVSGSLIFS